MNRTRLDCERYHLLPGHLWIYLQAEDVYPEDVVVFLRYFRPTWHRLPLSVRRVILAHWREWWEPMSHPVVLTEEQRRDPACALMGWPKVFTPLRLIGKHWRRGRAVGTCGIAGTEVQFKASAVRGYAAGYGVFLAEAIAHELAHVFQHAAGTWGTLGEYRQQETDAHRLVELWGFRRDKANMLFWQGCAREGLGA
jgi:hypothetical protein